MKYDDSEYYFLNFRTGDLPPSAGAIPMGFFVGWLIDRGLVAAEHAEMATQVRARAISGAHFVRDVLDGKLLSEDLNDEGNAFALAYYDAHYIDDYCTALEIPPGDEPDRMCSVAESWINHARVAAVLDRRFVAWQSDPPVPPRIPTETEAFAELTGAFVARFAAHGFVAAEPNRMSGGRQTNAPFERVVGSVRQQVVLVPMASRGGLVVRAQVRLYCPAVAAVWRTWLGSRLETLDARLRDATMPEATFRPHDLAAPGDADAAVAGEFQVIGKAPTPTLAAWFDRFEAWLAGPGLALLDAARDPRGLAALVVHARQLPRLRSRNDLGAHEIYARLVLAAAFPEVPFAEMLASLRDHHGRSHIPQFWPTVAPVFEELVEYVQSDGLANLRLRLTA